MDHLRGIVWVRFVMSCTSDMRQTSLVYRSRVSVPILVLGNRLTYINAGSGKRKCVANDNGED